MNICIVTRHTKTRLNKIYFCQKFTFECKDTSHSYKSTGFVLFMVYTVILQSGDPFAMLHFDL